MLRKILIVDDNKMNRQLLVRILSDEYEVLEAENGLRALDILEQVCDDLSAVLLDIIMPEMDGYEVLVRMRRHPRFSSIPVIVTTGSTEEGSEVKALSLGANDFVTKPYNPDVIRHRLSNTINLRETAAIVNRSRRDELTGLYGRKAFFDAAAKLIDAHKPGYYVMACFDVNNFKVINDQYGSNKGDDVLKQIADIFSHGFADAGGICSRITADNFAVLYPRSFMDSEKIAEIRRASSVLDGSIPPITFSIGRYIVDDLSLTVSAMYDRASMAESSVKGRFDTHIAQYDESMRDDLLREQEITSEMDTALARREFELWFQPQYNHATGALIGAEALVRWRRPGKGVISPGEFIPVFERNGFIYDLDKFVWEEACALLRGWLDEGRSPLPLSVNVSRYDLFRDDLVDVILTYLRKYDVPVSLLRLEITESAFATSTDQIVRVVRELIDCGFTIEIDDFGSGYSSLNTLKDVPAQVLKLDMRFLENDENSQRGGNILESIVRMAKWLGMSVIAEGVETRAQADYLLSIGSRYVQGYLYAKPMSAADYEALARSIEKEEKMLVLDTVENLDNNAFWDPRSMDTLIFNSYVGGACIFEYDGKRVEVLRANKRFVQVLDGGDLPVADAIQIPWIDTLDQKTRARARKALLQAMKTGAELPCELEFPSLSNRKKLLYVRAYLRVIARAGGVCMIYCTVENLTAQHEAEQRSYETSERLQAIMDSVNSAITAVVYNGEQMREIFVNDRYYEILGYTRQQYHDEIRDPLAFVHPDDREFVARHSADVNWTGEPATLEFRALRRDGSVIWMRGVISLTPFYGVEEPVEIGSFWDITAEKLAETRIRETSAQLQAILDNVTGGVSAATLSGGNTDYLFVNSKYYAMFGYTKEQFEAECPHGLTDIILPEDLPTVYKAAEESVRMSEPVVLEYRVRRRDGSVISVRTNSSACRLSGVELPVHIAVIYDITEEKQKEERIRVLGEELEDLMSDTPGAFARMQILPDQTIRITYVNDGFRELLGLTRQEVFDLLGASILTGVHPDDEETVRQIIANGLASGGKLHAKYRLRNSAGEYVWVVAFGRFSKNERGERFLNAYFTDPSEQERKELSYRELLPVVLAAVMESPTDISFVKDLSLRYVCCSRALAGLCETPTEPREIVGKTDYDLVSRALADKYHAIDCEILEGGQPLVGYVERLPSADGRARYASTSKYPLRDSLGNVIGIYGIGQDITESQAAYAQLKLLTENIPGGLATYECAPEGVRLLYFNDGYHRLSGYTREEYARKSAENPLFLVFEEDLPALRREIALMLQNDAPLDVAYRIRTKDGSIRWQALKGAVAYRNEETVAVNVVLLDATEQREGEERLRMSEEQYRLALQHSGNYICRYHVGDQTASMSEETAAMLCLPSTVTAVPQEPLRRGNVDKDSAEAFRAFFEQIRLGVPSGSGDFKCKTASGWRWLKVNYSTIFSDAGQPVYAIVSFWDTTEVREKEAEHEAVKQQERLFKKQAERDGMTGLYNKTTAETLISERLLGADASASALLIADLDDLKLINDALGHPQGDAALRQIADVLKAQFRKTDVVGRIGGDEFVVFLSDLGDEVKLRDIAATLLARLKDLRIGVNGDVPISVSIGAAMAKEDEPSFAALYRRADEALYHAKNSGKKQYAIWSPAFEPLP